MLADLRKIVNHSVIYGLGTMAPKLAGLVLIPLYTKHFSLVEFGILGLLDSTAQIIIGILGLALYQGFFRWYFEKEVETKKQSLFFTLLVVHILIALVSLVSIWLLSGQISMLFFDHEGYSYVVRVMAAASLVQMVVIMPSTLLRVQERAGLYTITNLIQMGIMVLFAIYFIIWKHQGVEAIYHAQLLGLVAYVLLLTGYIRKNLRWHIEWKLLGQITRYCMPLVISSIAYVSLNQADRFIIEAYGRLSDVGLYTLGFRLSNTLYILLVASVSFAIQPMIFKKMNDPNNKRFYSKLMTYFVLVVMIFVLGMSLFGKEIVKIFAKRPEYFEAYRIIPLLSFAILLNMMKDLATIGLQVAKKTKIVAGVIVVASIIGILLNIILVPLLHNQGAALAKFLTNSLFFLLLYHYAQKAFHIPYEKNKLIMMITVGAILYLPAEFINEYSLTIRLIIKSGLILIYPVVLYFLGFFEAVEIRRLKGAWMKWKSPSALLANLKSMKNPSG
jgi:O-antigen/teichoic acid export membrane protein